MAFIAGGFPDTPTPVDIGATSAGRSTNTKAVL